MEEEEEKKKEKGKEVEEKVGFHLDNQILKMNTLNN